MTDFFTQNMRDAFNPNGWSVRHFGNGDFEIVYGPFPN
jgi:hypothetical protein